MASQFPPIVLCFEKEVGKVAIKRIDREVIFLHTLGSKCSKRMWRILRKSLYYELCK